MTAARYLILFSSLLLMFTTPAAFGEGRKVALVVGIRKYFHSQLKDLDYACRDAASLAETLNEAGFSKVVLMTSDEEDDRLRPTYEHVEREIDSILKGIGKQDLLLIVFSGHGQENNDGENFFCCYDANPFTYENCVSLQPLLNRMHQCGVGSALLLVDACRDEAKLPRGAKGASGESILSLPSGVSAFFSCASNERSWESQEAGGGHGVFLHAFIEGIQGKAANERGNVTWDRLIAHVKDSVPDRVREWIGPDFTQSPHSVGNLVGSPILRKLPAGTPSESMRRSTSGGESLGKSILSKTTGAKLIRIPSGEFMMGSPESDADSDETPQHHVRISMSFYLGETEVTQGEWKKVMGTEPWKGKKNVREGDEYPATFVSWEDAVEYCKRLSEKDGREYRLPTEAEWEYACRAGTRTKWSFGDSGDELGDYAWYGDNAYDIGEEYAHQVGRKKPNAWGLRDMHGNVSEWCSDWKGYYPLGTVPGAMTDPQGPPEGSTRVNRGGDWTDRPVRTRSASRSAGSPNDRDDFWGFRLASISVE